MHHDSDEERMTTAEQLAGHDPRAAAEAFSAIACDGEVGDEVRLSAAEQLPGQGRRSHSHRHLGLRRNR
jgi:hypothetical protein